MTVDANRLRDLTLELVEVESPTGDTADVARLLRAAARGDRAWTSRCSTTSSPRRRSSIGRLRGGEPGPTIVLNGHLDTVPIPHEPARIENGSVYGRGSRRHEGRRAPRRPRRCASSPARALVPR